MAAGIRTLPTPTPLGTVWPQKRDPLLEQIVLGLEKITQPTVLALKANIVPNTENSEAFQWKSVWVTQQMGLSCSRLWTHLRIRLRLFITCRHKSPGWRRSSFNTLILRLVLRPNATPWNCGLHDQVKMACTTRPWTSVSRKSRPPKR
jgi:hypothetical protein